MPIQLPKTLHGEDFTFYILIQIRHVDGRRIVIEGDAYKSKGHFDDGFYPVLSKRAALQNQTLINTVKALSGVDDALALRAVEEFLIAQNPFFSGGQIVVG